MRDHRRVQYTFNNNCAEKPSRQIQTPEKQENVISDSMQIIRKLTFISFGNHNCVISDLNIFKKIIKKGNFKSLLYH